MIARFFIDRPNFAFVIAIFIMLAGLAYSFVPFISQEIGRLGPELEAYLMLLRG